MGPDTLAELLAAVPSLALEPWAAIGAALEGGVWTAKQRKRVATEVAATLVAAGAAVRHPGLAALPHVVSHLAAFWWMAAALVRRMAPGAASDAGTTAAASAAVVGEGEDGGDEDGGRAGTGSGRILTRLEDVVPLVTIIAAALTAAPSSNAVALRRAGGGEEEGDDAACPVAAALEPALAALAAHTASPTHARRAATLFAAPAPPSTGAHASPLVTLLAARDVLAARATRGGAAAAQAVRLLSVLQDTLAGVLFSADAAGGFATAFKTSFALAQGAAVAAARAAAPPPSSTSAKRPRTDGASTATGGAGAAASSTTTAVQVVLPSVVSGEQRLFVALAAGVAAPGSRAAVLRALPLLFQLYLRHASGTGSSEEAVLAAAAPADKKRKGGVKGGGGGDKGKGGGDGERLAADPVAERAFALLAKLPRYAFFLELMALVLAFDGAQDDGTVALEVSGTTPALPCCTRVASDAADRLRAMAALLAALHGSGVYDAYHDNGAAPHVQTSALRVCAAWVACQLAGAAAGSDGGALAAGAAGCLAALLQLNTALGTPHLVAALAHTSRIAAAAPASDDGRDALVALLTTAHATMARHRQVAALVASLRDATTAAGAAAAPLYAAMAAAPVAAAAGHGLARLPVGQVAEVGAALLQATAAHVTPLAAAVAAAAAAAQPKKGSLPLNVLATAGSDAAGAAAFATLLAEYLRQAAIAPTNAPRWAAFLATTASTLLSPLRAILHVTLTAATSPALTIAPPARASLLALVRALCVLAAAATDAHVVVAAATAAAAPTGTAATSVADASAGDACLDVCWPVVVAAAGDAAAPRIASGSTLAGIAGALGGAGAAAAASMTTASAVPTAPAVWSMVDAFAAMAAVAAKGESAGEDATAALGAACGLAAAHLRLWEVEGCRTGAPRRLPAARAALADALLAPTAAPACCPAALPEALRVGTPAALAQFAAAAVAAPATLLHPLLADAATVECTGLAPFLVRAATDAVTVALSAARAAVPPLVAAAAAVAAGGPSAAAAWRRALSPLPACTPLAHATAADALLASSLASAAHLPIALLAAPAARIATPALFRAAMLAAVATAAPGAGHLLTHLAAGDACSVEDVSASLPALQTVARSHPVLLPALASCLAAAVRAAAATGDEAKVAAVLAAVTPAGTPDEAAVLLHGASQPYVDAAAAASGVVPPVAPLLATAAAALPLAAAEPPRSSRPSDAARVAAARLRLALVAQCGAGSNKKVRKGVVKAREEAEAALGAAQAAAVDAGIGAEEARGILDAVADVYAVAQQAAAVDEDLPRLRGQYTGATQALLLLGAPFVSVPAVSSGERQPLLQHIPPPAAPGVGGDRGCAPPTPPPAIPAAGARRGGNRQQRWQHATARCRCSRRHRRHHRC